MHVPVMRAFVIVLALGVVSIARADVVDPEPERCPRGSTPATAHSGPFCRADDTCASDAECSTGQRCVAIAQCLETRGCGGRTDFEDAEPCTLTHVSGECESAGGSCGDEGTCTERRVCAGEAERPGGGGCSCAAPGRARAGTGLVLAIATLATMFLARRRRAG
ncbi:hypothetical protein [Sandaracinus amylolyticus]|uniref:hypothetical protein n=1 Tax=Sandaracinus amylolyticus TaxID=927083 RepID=UPI001F31843C|nr:hypothetical protein [Sandaracinus amylolyticus]UJR85243.1 Hypothetical protein I5071_73230 [Sandaracinus amylolyticus]